MLGCEFSKDKAYDFYGLRPAVAEAMAGGPAAPFEVMADVSAEALAKADYFT